MNSTTTTMKSLHTLLQLSWLTVLVLVSITISSSTYSSFGATAIAADSDYPYDSYDYPLLNISGFSWAENLIFDGAGSLFVSDFTTGILHKIYFDDSSDSYQVWNTRYYFDSLISRLEATTHYTAKYNPPLYIDRAVCPVVRTRCRTRFFRW